MMNATQTTLSTFKSITIIKLWEHLLGRDRMCQPSDSARAAHHVGALAGARTGGYEGSLKTTVALAVLMHAMICALSRHKIQ